MYRRGVRPRAGLGRRRRHTRPLRVPGSAA